jgi:hypothetical protein
VNKMIKADSYLSNFITCLLWLAGAKKKEFKDDDFIFYKKTMVTFKPFTLDDFGITSEHQMIKLPKVKKTVLAANFIKDVNELERWLNKKGYTLRNDFPVNEEEVENLASDKNSSDRKKANV